MGVFVEQTAHGYRIGKRRGFALGKFVDWGLLILSTRLIEPNAACPLKALASLYMTCSGEGLFSPREEEKRFN